ncbi:MAG TPA: hypothetical protein G4O03_00940 [Dehalococcoidia bacterium]|nr:hypothetical protein [Dehalococcoidia bacterium]
MEIKKTYKNVNPELLFDEVKDFVEKHGAEPGESMLQTYSLPDGASHIVRSTATFKVREERGGAMAEGIRLHIVGSTVGETKMMLDIDERLVAQEKIAALQSDLEFMFGSYEVKPK